MCPKAFSLGEQKQIIQQISDLESGHARQWYWLEIAQALPAAEKTRRTKAMGICLKLFGIKLLSPILLKLDIRGLLLYQASARYITDFFRQKSNDALLFTGCMLALLLGFQRLPASLQFATWCLSLGGAGWQIIRVYRQAKPRSADEQIDPLPGAESSLGLPSILLAAGVASGPSLALVKGIKHDPETFIGPLLQALPSLAPEHEASLPHQCMLASTSWLLLGVSNSYLLGLGNNYWGTAATFLWLALLAIGLHRKQRAAWILLITAWAGCFALASLAHYL
ncbi:hypothetical protein ABHF33_02375 [Chitinibacter sp. FCG-7]|uniref:Uncharacterized protein n=1 Tax=Chitinibacter mangrovi TaxID=3153927 RepID=A0AAU7FBU5_9NEIS